MRAWSVALLSISLLLSQSAALSINTLPAAHRAAVPTFAARFSCAPRLQEQPPPTPEAEAAAPAAPPAWFEDEAESSVPVAAPPPPPLAPEDPTTVLSVEDVENTRWDLKATARPDSWMGGIWGGGEVQEFTLLSDGSVVWGGGAGGFGTGGRWSLKDGLLEVIRSTPLGLVTGRDYYMAEARAGVDEKLQFKLNGIIRSYNAIYPVMVIADFEATRRPGRFVRDVEEDEE